jgi:hypothetical protein
MANFTGAALDAGKTDQRSATAPETNGAAALVPLSVCDWRSEPRLVILSPGALSPRLPMVLPGFVASIGRP